MSMLIDMMEKGLLPDTIIRRGIRRLLQRRLASFQRMRPRSGSSNVRHRDNGAMGARAGATAGGDDLEVFDSTSLQGAAVQSQPDTSLREPALV